MSTMSFSPSLPKDQISQLAYDSYLKEGSLPGRAFQHWTTAESILRLGLEPQSRLTVSYANGELWVGIKPAELSKLDEDALTQIEQALARMIDVLPQPRVVIDLSSVHYLCSTMLGLLAFLNRRAKLKGGRLAIAHVPPSLRGEIRLSGFECLIEVAN